MLKTDNPIIVDQHFNTSKERVWYAITEPEQMKQWFFDNIETFEPRVGFTTRFVIEKKAGYSPMSGKYTK